MAPPDLLLRYLVLFQRALDATRRAAETDDYAALLFCGYLANALHNAPVMLLDYGEDTWNTPERIGEEIAGLLLLCEESGAPPHVLKLCRDVTEAFPTPTELGLTADGVDADFAPDKVVGRYLRLLKNNFFVWIRLIRNLGGESPHYWDGRDPDWGVDASEAGRASGWVAAILQPIPCALVHWSTWDETAFWTGLWTRVQERYGTHAHRSWRPYWPPGWQPPGGQSAQGT